jgi:MOSC domain-containing protein YiiM
MSHVSLKTTAVTSSPDHGQCLALYVSGKPAAEIALDSGGVIGDGHYGKNPTRAIMIASTLAYEKARQNGINLREGALEENILVDFDPYDLPLETRIHIGDVVVELAQYGTICKSLTRIDNQLPKLLKGERGIFARVIQSGTILAGDAVRVQTA